MWAKQIAKGAAIVTTTAAAGAGVSMVQKKSAEASIGEPKNVRFFPGPVRGWGPDTGTGAKKMSPQGS